MPMPTSPRPVPDKILQPELAALAQCLKVSNRHITLIHNHSYTMQDVVIRTGQIYSFYADVRRL